LAGKHYLFIPERHRSETQSGPNKTAEAILKLIQYIAFLCKRFPRLPHRSATLRLQSKDNAFLLKAGKKLADVTTSELTSISILIFKKPLT